MGRRGPKPKEPEKRISGTGYDPETREGKAAIRQLKYSKISDDGIHREIDTDQIKSIIDEYIDEERRTHTVKTYKKDGSLYTEDTILDPISRAGLRIALGISRDTYTRWMEGIVSYNDAKDEMVACNIELSEAVRAGDDEIARYYTERGEAKTTQKDIRILETMGELSGKSEPVRQTNIYNLGSLKMYGD